MIVIQKSVTRDIIGIANALSSIGKPAFLWDPTKDDISDVDEITTVIINDDSTIGYRTFNSIPKVANVLLLNMEEKPKNLQQNKNCYLIKIPMCADDVLYPPGYFMKDYACDISYISNFTLEGRPYVQGTIGFIPARKYKMRVVGSVPMNVVPYMGPINREHVIKLCKSSRVCIDFDFNIAIDLIYHGCSVITNIENEWIPYFTDSNILQVIEEEMKKTPPVINETKEKAGIITYSEFLPSILEYIR